MIVIENCNSLSELRQKLIDGEEVRTARQEPCEDVISRQAVLDKKELVELEDGQSFYCISPEDVETLPPVNPQPKTIQEKQAESEKYDKAFDDGYKNGYAQARFDYEQEPKTVLYSGDGYADGYMVYDMAECPNCSYEYEDGDKDWGLPFCPSCGQKLNWESEEQE